MNADYKFLRRAGWDRAAARELLDIKKGLDRESDCVRMSSPPLETESDEKTSFLRDHLGSDSAAS